jgi:hypothetical protein
MANTINMKNTEKRVFRFAIFEDGLWEIYLGIFFILMSFYPIIREILGPVLNAVLVLGVVILMATIITLARKHVIQPRTGLVRFGQPTKKKIRVANLVTIGLVLGTLTLVILGANSLLKAPAWAYLPQWSSDFSIDLIFALVIIGFFSLIGYTTGVARFYIHGVLIGIGNLATAILLVNKDVPFGWPIALAGLIIALIGTYVLIKFLAGHPLPNEEISNDR